MSAPTYSVVAVARTPQAATGPTLVELGPLLGALSWTESLRGPGDAAVSANIDALTGDIKTRLLDLAAYPMEVWVYRNSTKVFAGPVIATETLDGVITLTCRDLLFYLNYFIVTANKSWVAVEQADIVAEMVDDWQALSYGNYGIDTSGVAATGTVRTFAIPGATEFPIVLTETLNLAGAVSGFDIYIDPATRALTIESVRGSDLSASVFLERGMVSPQVMTSVAPGIIASEVFAVGTGPNVDPALLATASDTGLRASFGRAGVARRFDPVIDQTHLDDLADQAISEVGAQVFQVSPGELIPVSDARYDDFGAGDIVTFSFDYGLGTHTAAYRVAARRVTVDDDGTEKMSVEFD